MVIVTCFIKLNNIGFTKYRLHITLTYFFNIILKECVTKAIKYLDLIWFWFDFWCLNATFKHRFWAISWRLVVIDWESRSSRRKRPTFNRKTDNPSQIRLESIAPTRAGFELTTSVLTGYIDYSSN